MLLYGKNSCGEVQVTICKHTDHLYVCMLHTVRQANEAKKFKESYFKLRIDYTLQKHEQTPCTQTSESSKPSSISMQKSRVAMLQLEDSKYLLNMYE